MVKVSRKGRMNWADDRILIYSALFLICALMNAIGGGVVGFVAFLPAALMIELVARNKRAAGPGHQGKA
jgi:hypothetical protein